jgi:thymidylate synthase
LVFGEKYHDQFVKVIAELINNPDSRRAQLIYNRPSIWHEYNENKKSDFICTNAQTFYIRNNQLHMVSQMRSQDVVHGYRNDIAWAKYLQNYAIEHLKRYYPDLTAGTIYWQVMNLHVYEQHFHLVK